MDDKYPGPGGDRPEDIRAVFKGSCTGGVAFRVRDVGLDVPDGWALGSLHHRVAQRLTGRQPRQRGKRRWYYPTLVSVMEEAGFGEIGVNITRRKNAVAQYIATRPILDLCERSARRPGARVSWRWLEQASLDLEGEKKRAAVAAADSD